MYMNMKRWVVLSVAGLCGIIAGCGETPFPDSMMEEYCKNDNSVWNTDKGICEKKDLEKKNICDPDTFRCNNSKLEKCSETPDGRKWKVVDDKEQCESCSSDINTIGKRSDICPSDQKP